MTRILWTGDWAFAFAEMIDVARLFAGLVLVTMGIAVVHDVDYLGVGESQSRVRSMPDAALIILVTRDDGESSICGERFSAIVHDGAVVVGYSEVVGSGLDVEVVLVASAHIVEENFDGSVAVDATLLVMKSYGVS